MVRAVEYVAELERHQFTLTKSANTSYETQVDGLRDLLGKPSQKDLSLRTVGKVLDELMLKVIFVLLTKIWRESNNKMYTSEKYAYFLLR